MSLILGVSLIAPRVPASIFDHVDRITPRGHSLEATVASHIAPLRTRQSQATSSFRNTEVKC